MTDDLIARVETQLSSVVTSSAGVPTEKTIRDYGRTPVCREDIEALIAYVRELEAQAAIWEPLIIAGKERDDIWKKYDDTLVVTGGDDDRLSVLLDAWAADENVTMAARAAYRAALAARGEG